MAEDLARSPKDRYFARLIGGEIKLAMRRIGGDRVRARGSTRDRPGRHDAEGRLIDAHTHFTLQYKRDYYHFVHTLLMRFPAEQALYGALYARRTLEAGFTTWRNVGADDFVDISLRNAINAGVTEGPHMLTAAHEIGSPGQHFDNFPYPPDRAMLWGPIEGICSGAEQCRAT
ncbi:MAG TPA: hypothetical protein VIY68_21070 [Steroidobacteraceae bacterium]